MPTIPIRDDLQGGLGVGYDNTTGTTKAVAIDFDPPPLPAPGQEVTLELLSIESSRELTEKLSIDISASFKQGVGGASAEFNLSQSYEINQYFTYALMKVNVKNTPQLLTNPRLSEQAKEFITQNQNDEAAFFRKFGDQFVEGVITGGSYYALIQIQTTNEKQQQETKTKLSGFYGTFKASAEFRTTFQEIQKNSVTNIYLAQKGGSGDNLEITLDAMLQQVESFPSLIKNSPVNIAVITANYSDKVIFPNLPEPGSLPNGNQEEVLEDFGIDYYRFRDYRSNLKFILERFTEFDDFRDLEADELEAKKQEYQDSLESVEEGINEIVKRAERCQKDYRQCEVFTPNINFLPLPTIGGELLSIKQMEEQLAALRSEIASLSGLRSEITSLKGEINKTNERTKFIKLGDADKNVTIIRAGQRRFALIGNGNISLWDNPPNNAPDREIWTAF